MKATKKLAFIQVAAGLVGIGLAFAVFTAEAAGRVSSRSVGGAENHFTLHLGLSSQDFSGVSGSDFSRIEHYYYGAGFQHSWGLWTGGLRYTALPSAAISRFTLATNESGQYNLDFQRIELLVGLDFSPFYVSLVIGNETMKISGAPELDAEPASTFQYGLDMSYDFDWTPNLKIPLQVTILLHPERPLSFKNYASDSFTVSAGTEFMLGTGVAIVF